MTAPVGSSPLAQPLGQALKVLAQAKAAAGATTRPAAVATGPSRAAPSAAVEQAVPAERAATADPRRFPRGSFLDLSA